MTRDDNVGNDENAIAAELAALRSMSMSDLIAKHVELFGRSPRTLHRGAAEHATAHALQTLRLGGLSDDAQRALDALIAEVAPRLAPPSAPDNDRITIATATATDPPMRPRTTGRAPASFADASATRPPRPRPANSSRPSASTSGLVVGTTLVKEWRGRRLVLVVRDDHVEVDGVRYRSLSHAATVLAGVRWNGRAFFGVKTTKPKPKAAAP